MSPFLALAMLVMAVKKNMPITDEQYDEAYDALVAVLEDANNQRYPANEEEET